MLPTNHRKNPWPKLAEILQYELLQHAFALFKLTALTWYGVSPVNIDWGGGPWLTDKVASRDVGDIGDRSPDRCHDPRRIHPLDGRVGQQSVLARRFQDPRIFILFGRAQSDLSVQFYHHRDLSIGMGLVSNLVLNCIICVTSLFIAQRQSFFAEHQFAISVDCEWSRFSDWSECSVSCGGGIQRRRRTVLVEAERGGRRCIGRTEETRICKTDICPNPAGGKWNNYLLKRTIPFSYGQSYEHTPLISTKMK